WGRNVAEFADAARQMIGADVAAIEVNASCPNLDDRSAIFAHSSGATSDVVSASRVAGVPLWVKLSPNTPDLVAIAGAAIDAGAAALVLGNGGGGVSGPGILPVALRAVYECRAAYPRTPIVGVGGVSTGEDAVAMLM